MYTVIIFLFCGGWIGRIVVGCTDFEAKKVVLCTVIDLGETGMLLQGFECKVMKVKFSWLIRAVFSISLLLGAALSLQSQCTPDPNIPQPGVFPNPLPGAVAGAQYNQVVDIVFRGDTVYLSQLTPFDSISIDDVLAPSGLSYSCSTNPNPCLFYPPSLGDNVRACISLDGITIDSIGMNQFLELSVTKWVTSVGLPVALRDTFRVGFADLVGVEVGRESLFEGVGISPNPSRGQFFLRGEVVGPILVDLRIVNIHGQVIMQAPPQRFNSRFDLPIDLGQEAPGIYFVQLITEKGMATWKVMAQ